MTKTSLLEEQIRSMEHTEAYGGKFYCELCEELEERKRVARNKIQSKKRAKATSAIKAQIIRKKQKAK